MTNLVVCFSLNRLKLISLSTNKLWQQLNSIFEQHKLWLKNQGGERAQLGNTDLSNLALQDVDLRCANLIRTDFSGADLSGANMNDADITYANMSHAQMLNVDLLRADLFRTDFSNAQVSDSAFKRIDTGNTIIELRDPTRQCLSAK